MNYNDIYSLINRSKYEAAEEIIKSLISENENDSELFYLLFQTENGGYPNLKKDDIKGEIFFNKALELAPIDKKKEYLAEYKLYTKMNGSPREIFYHAFHTNVKEFKECLSSLKERDAFFTSEEKECIKTYIMDAVIPQRSATIYLLYYLMFQYYGTTKRISFFTEKMDSLYDALFSDLTMWGRIKDESVIAGLYLSAITEFHDDLKDDDEFTPEEFLGMTDRVVKDLEKYKTYMDILNYYSYRFHEVNKLDLNAFSISLRKRIANMLDTEEVKKTDKGLILLARMYEDGYCVEKDLLKSRRYYEEAYKKGNERAASPLLAMNLNHVVEEGSLYLFGFHEGKPLTWIVLRKTDEYLYLISEDILKAMSFGKSNKYMKSYVRSFLSLFYLTSFTSVEKDRFVEKKDPLTLLRTKDLSNIKDISILRASGTDSAISEGLYVNYNFGNDRGTSYWWVLPEDEKTLKKMHALAIDFSGDVTEHHVSEDRFGIRPVTWIKL